jgi:nucleotide-binding universal stress UspA family protein
MYHRILIAIDQEESLERLVTAAVHLAAPGARATVVKVTPVEDVADEQADRALVDKAAERLEAAGLKALSHVLITTRKPAAAIARMVRSVECDLVVMGSRGLSGFRALAVGSVSHGVAGRTNCALALVRVGGEARTPRRHPRLLIALRGDEDPEALARDAVAAEPSEALVVHIREKATGGMSHDVPLYLESPETGQAIVGALTARLAEAGLAVTGTVLPAAGGVAATIAHLADTYDAGLVLLGSRRPSDLDGLLMGSVAHAVLHLTARPVLLAERAVRTPVLL